MCLCGKCHPSHALTPCGSLSRGHLCSSHPIAAIQLNEDLHFTPTIFGLGSGIFFLGYATLQVPVGTDLSRGICLNLFQGTQIQVAVSSCRGSPIPNLPGPGTADPQQPPAQAHPRQRVPGNHHPALGDVRLRLCRHAHPRPVLRASAAAGHIRGGRLPGHVVLPLQVWIGCLCGSLRHPLSLSAPPIR